jgi:outer membrane protein assembly factor BamB
VRPSGVIDLESPSPSKSFRTTPARRRRRRVSAVALAVIVVVALTGPIHHGPSLTLAWRGNAFQGFLWVDDDAAYTAEATRVGLRLVARDLASGRPRWERPLDGPLAMTYASRSTFHLARFPAFPWLPAVTQIIDGRTAQLLGTYPVPAVPLVYFADDVAVVIDRVPDPLETRSGAELVSYDGWSEAHTVVAVDVVNGAALWSRTIAPGSFWALPSARPQTEGFTGEKGAGRWMAVVGPQGATEVWDLATGAVSAHGTIGGFDTSSYAIALPHLLVMHSTSWPQTVLVGYDSRTLVELWRLQATGLPDTSGWPTECGGLLCLASPYVVWALDPKAGRVLWNQQVVEIYGDEYAKLVAATLDGPVIVDTSSGVAQPLGGGWRIVETRTLGRPMVIARAEGNRTQLGLLDQDSGHITVLDDVGIVGPLAQCHGTPTHVACTSGTQIRVWRIRS